MISRSAFGQTQSVTTSSMVSLSRHRLSVQPEYADYYLPRRTESMGEFLAWLDSTEPVEDNELHD